MRAVCQEWFPGAKLDRLPPSHPVWFAERKVDLSKLEKDFWVYGVQACCRTAVFYVPQSLSCRWELSDVLFVRGKQSDAVRDKIGTAVRIGQNIIAYATGRELKDKLQQRTVLGGSVLEATARGAIRLAMLGVDAGGQEARRAMPNAAGIIGRRIPIKLSVAPESINFDTESLQEVAVLWLHGRTAFALSEEQREALRDYLENGGVILGSSICGSEAFTKSFREQLALILPDSSLEPMPSDHPAFSPVFDGFDVRRVQIRTPKVTAGGQSFAKRTGPPMLETASIGGINCVFFSPLDLSCALESSNSVQCPGYNTDDAAKIVANMLLFAIQQ